MSRLMSLRCSPHGKSTFRVLGCRGDLFSIYPFRGRIRKGVMGAMAIAASYIRIDTLLKFSGILIVFQIDILIFAASSKSFDQNII